MKGDRKLSLVKAPSSAPGAELPSPVDEALAKGLAIELPEGEPEVTEAELREAEALRASLDRGEDPFASALRAALSPSPAAERDLESILAHALGDLEAPPTSIEEGEAERLRVTLEEHDAERAGRLVAGPGRRTASHEVPRSISGGVDGGALAVALRVAWAPGPLGAAKNDALVGRALVPQSQAGSGASAHPTPAARGSADGGGAPAPISLRRFRLGPRTFATMTAVVAMAAGVLLLVGRIGQQSDAPAPAAVAVATSMPRPPAARPAVPGAVPDPSADRTPRIAVRSTADLFDATTPFPRTGGESARVDRIAGARAADLRANRFAAWGVR